MHNHTVCKKRKATSFFCFLSPYLGFLCNLTFLTVYLRACCWSMRASALLLGLSSSGPDARGSAEAMHHSCHPSSSGPLSVCEAAPSLSLLMSCSSGESLTSGYCFMAFCSCNSLWDCACVFFFFCVPVRVICSAPFVTTREREKGGKSCKQKQMWVRKTFRRGSALHSIFTADYSMWGWYMFYFLLKLLISERWVTETTVGCRWMKVAGAETVTFWLRVVSNGFLNGWYNTGSVGEKFLPYWDFSFIVCDSGFHCMWKMLRHLFLYTLQTNAGAAAASTLHWYLVKEKPKMLRHLHTSL